MSTSNDPREGLSPSPPNILDLFDEDGDSDVDFAPATDEDPSTQASDSNTEYTGRCCFFMTISPSAVKLTRY